MSENKYEMLDNPDAYLKSKKMDLESGLLGKFFGTGSSANNNVAGLILVLLVVLVSITTIYNLNATDKTPSLDFLKTVTPLITLILGYIFGRKP